MPPGQQSGHPPGLSRINEIPRFRHRLALFDASSAVRLRSSSSTLPDGIRSRLFPQRSPPRLFTVAACGSLKPAPDGRLRGAYPHLLCSSALPLLVVRSRRTLVQMPSIAWPRPTLAQPSRNRRAELQHPTPHRFIGDVEPALGEQFLRVAVAQRKAEI